MNVFGIGLSRTGTKSLTLALNMLNIKTIHYPCDNETLQDLIRGDANFSILSKGYNGLTDITTVPYFQQLFSIYGNEAKFILTVRQKQSWLKSLEQHWQNRPAYNDPNETEIHMEIRRFLRAAVFGCLNFNKERMSFVYDNYHQQVNSFFKDKKNLLTMDITEGDGWEKLCPFLGMEIPNEDFPVIKTDNHLESSITSIIK